MTGADLTLGQLLAAASGIGGVVIAAWTQFGKSKDTSYMRVVADRDRLDMQVKELREQQQAIAGRLQRVEDEMKSLRLDHQVVLDFLRDIVSGVFSWEQIRARAADLLGRFGGERGEEEP